jgi:mannose-6-phosphate isomerase-like protein (cupin superfamily)
MQEEILAQSVPASIVVQPNEGTVLRAFGDVMQVKLSGEQTAGSKVVLLGNVPPGGGPPPHIHHNEDELFLILAGSFRFLVGEGWSDPIGAGAVVYTPCGVRHTFQNVGETRGQYWMIATPSGFEQFFAQCADVFAGSTVPDVAQIVAIGDEHGIEFVPPLV